MMNGGSFLFNIKNIKMLSIMMLTLIYRLLRIKFYDYYFSS